MMEGVPQFIRSRFRHTDFAAFIARGQKRVEFLVVEMLVQWARHVWRSFISNTDSRGNLLFGRFPRFLRGVASLGSGRGGCFSAFQSRFPPLSCPTRSWAARRSP